ncbi:MAG: DivIVA domain-containing protein [Oscillospiraceae bacterium]|jgi:DivIVA domain-containing protein
MMTPQDIREKQFERAMLNGYSSTSVDEFMEEIAVEYAALCKEISTQRKKMKVLVDEIEKYRASDGAMRMALLQAQKTCEELTDSAQKTAQATLSAAQSEADAIRAQATADSEAILASAQKQYDEIVGGIHAAAEREEVRLSEAKRSSAQFIANMRNLCTRQLQYFEAFASVVPAADAEDSAPVEINIPEGSAVPVEEPAVTEDSVPVVEEPEAIEKPVPVIEESETADESDPAKADESSEESSLDEILSDQVDDRSAEPLSPEENPLAGLMDGLLHTEEADASDLDDATKKFNFDDLKGLNFGR